MNLFKYTLNFCILIITAFGLTININRFYIRPNSDEINLIKSQFGNIIIREKNDILKIQNSVIDKSIPAFVSDGEIKVSNVLNKGLCYDRSLILQKILIFNNIPIRPVYLYYGGVTDTFFDLVLTRKLGSHSVFEFKFNDQYYVMKTNSKMVEFQKIEEYLSHENTNFIFGKTKYIRYLSNRHGRFIRPSWIPDIYFFN